MNKNRAPERDQMGLCADCLHARRVENAHGSVFILCKRSANDTAYPKYPRLPVLVCPGHESKGARKAPSV